MTNDETATYTSTPSLTLRVDLPVMVAQSSSRSRGTWVKVEVSDRVNLYVAVKLKVGGRRRGHGRGSRSGTTAPSCFVRHVLRAPCAAESVARAVERPAADVIGDQSRDRRSREISTMSVPAPAVVAPCRVFTHAVMIQ